LKLAVRLTPRGGRDAIDGFCKDEAGRPVLKVRVAAPPVDGEANAALIRLIAKTLGLPRADVRLASGETARLKVLEIDLDENEVRARLG
jgi:hypothetical protein